jgi:ABC-2 type transport system permease protein
MNTASVNRTQSVGVALSVATKDFKILSKDRGTLITLFVVPLVFILAFSSLLGGGSDPEEQLITLPVVNLDAGSEGSQALIDALNKAGGVQVELYEQEQAQKLLDEGELARVLTVPAGYAADTAGGLPVTLPLVSDPDASQETNEAVQAVVTGVARDQSLETQLVTGLERMGDMMAGAPDEYQVFTTERIVAQARSQFERAKTAPLVGVEEAWPEHLLGEREDFSAVELAVPGFTILFVFLTAQTTAMSIYQEKKAGSFRRLLAAPVSNAELLVGKMVPNFVVVLVQIVVIFGASMLLLPLLGMDRLTLGNDPLAFVLVSLLIALCSTSLGLLIAAIAKTEGQISGIATVVLWVMAAVGGSFIPNFLLGDFLGAVGRVVPHYWANRAYNNLIVRGQGLADITPELAVLLGFTAVFLLIGLWQFEFDR